jgi:hypothetical protein
MCVFPIILLMDNFLFWIVGVLWRLGMLSSLVTTSQDLTPMIQSLPVPTRHRSRFSAAVWVEPVGTVI